ncbi:MAG TPA: DNA repair protein RadC [Mucilaginibacter sp.]|nr:DNA repair protein RadC [Mucilaginibacter sp.]
MFKPYHENKISIKAWAEEDRPREKLSAQGRRALTDAELIAILISSGNDSESAVELSKRILHHYGNDLDKLAKASIAELCNFRGIGEAKAISIIAALEIGRRRNDAEEKPAEFIKSSRDAYNLLRRHLVDLAHEEFWMILIGRSGKIMGRELVSKGGMSHTIADPRIIFRSALLQNATGVILVHNHPSGNLKPSQADIDLTKQLRSAGKLLEIQVLDHLIITDSGYMSFGDEGLL